MLQVPSAVPSAALPLVPVTEASVHLCSIQHCRACFQANAAPCKAPRLTWCAAYVINPADTSERCRQVQGVLITMAALRIDEEEFGGHQALAGEGLAPALAMFVVRLAEATSGHAEHAYMPYHCAHAISRLFLLAVFPSDGAPITSAQSSL